MMPAMPISPLLRPGIRGPLVRPRRVGLVALLVGCLALGPALNGWALASAADDTRPKLTEAQKQEVRDRYERATRFYYLRKYPEAISEYEAIYLLSADPVMLYNIAQCHRQADHPEQALQFYKTYLRNAPAATNRADVEKKITEMERLVEEQRKLAQQAPAVPVVPPPAVSPPPAGVGVGTPGQVPVPQAPAPAVGTAAGQVETSAAPPAPPSRVWPMIFMVGGGVFLATSIVLGAAAVSKAHEVESAAKGRVRAFDSNLQNTETSGQAASGLAVATGLIGTAALGTGIYLWFRARRKAELAGSAQVIPVATLGYAGVTARVGF
jgi:tetratricopeptide (TPR) repeat protein